MRIVCRIWQPSVNRGRGSLPEAPIDLPSFDMGRPVHPIDRARQTGREIELDDVRHELERGSSPAGVEP